MIDEQSQKILVIANKAFDSVLCITDKALVTGCVWNIPGAERDLRQFFGMSLW
jgi:hypothetical protein